MSAPSAASEVAQGNGLSNKTYEQGFTSLFTKAIHAGQSPEPLHGAVIPPIYMTSTYAQEAPAVHKGYDYTRAGNPTFTGLEIQLAALEGAKYATVFASGLSAFSALMSTLKSGDVVIAFQSLYGGTFRLLDKVFSPLGIHHVLLQTCDWPALEKAVSGDFSGAANLSSETEKELRGRRPRIFIFETPTNPLLEVVDIEKAAAICKRNSPEGNMETADYQGPMVVCDNTFATTCVQKPLLLNADVVVHSSTKYIGGHSDVIGGVLATNLEWLRDKLNFVRMSMGLNPSPFDCWMLTRSTKTLPLRVERHCSNAMKVAEHFASHTHVKTTLYPGLATHPQHLVAKKQMVKNMYGGIVSVDFKLSYEQTIKALSSFKVFTLAESLGGVESLVCHPASMTHASIPPEIRTKIGITDGLVRFSVGVEDVEDLLADIDFALAAGAKYGGDASHDSTLPAQAKKVPKIDR
eukprot:GHVU01026423.1.p1 GENE.GHVU01026423.1~~GHVU01026423.1.p1  ORF type:complete len:493 (-),score=64.97 GHVU01026423.1:612-2003(-)